MAARRADVVIVGGGHAGGACALALRRFGFSGSICVIGSEPVAPYERPSLSKELLVGKESEPRYLASVEQWHSRDIALLLKTTAERINCKRRTIDVAGGASLSYGTLVLATGGRPRQLSGGQHSPRILSLRSEADSRAIASRARHSRSVILVGGGVIGLEAAAGLRSMGLDVTVVELADQLLARNAPRGVAAWIERIHRHEGTTIRLSKAVTAIEDTEDEVSVTLGDGAKLRADFLLVGIGIEPASNIAAAAGLLCLNGIVVDERYRSVSEPSVYAIGDVAARLAPGETTPTRMDTWAHTQTSAEAAARAICGLPDEPTPLAWWWTHQFDHLLQVAGSTGESDRVVERGAHIQLYLDKNDVIVAAAMLDAPKEFALARRLIVQRAAVDVVRAADTGVPLRDLVVRASAPVLAPVGAD